MSKKNQKNSDFKGYKAIHPRIVLQKFLDSNDLTQKQLAERVGVVNKTINEIMKEKTGISVEMAVKLEKVFNVEASFWLNLQREYDETLVRIELQTKAGN